MPIIIMRKSEKNSGLKGIQTHHHRDTGAVLWLTELSSQLGADYFESL